MPDEIIEPATTYTSFATSTAPGGSEFTRTFSFYDLAAHITPYMTIIYGPPGSGGGGGTGGNYGFVS